MEDRDYARIGDVIFANEKSEEDAPLTLLQPLIARHLETLVDEFVCHVRSSPEAPSALIFDEVMVAWLKRTQQRYLQSLVTGPYDAVYREYRLQMGRGCDRLGVPPRLYVNAYGHCLTLLYPRVLQEFGERPDLCQRIWRRFTDRVFSDLELAIEAYFAGSKEKLESAGHELAVLSRALGLDLADRTSAFLRVQDQVRQVKNLTERCASASAAACEMGTPLNVILGRAESLLLRTDDEVMRRGLQAILTQVERLILLRTQLRTQLMNLYEGLHVECHSIDLEQKPDDTLDLFPDLPAGDRLQLDQSESITQPGFLKESQAGSSKSATL